jgi:hypothetical protein
MRNIDWDSPLSEDDKTWARDRDLHDKIAANEARFAQSNDAPSDDDDIVESDGAAELEDTEETDDYDDWKLSELKDEAATRQPAVDVTGLKKAEIITALRVWDGEHAKSA